MQPDITSLESGDNHRHPNSQLMVAQQDRKTTASKKVAKHLPTQSLSKESFTTGKSKQIKKQSKFNVVDGRSSSKGPVTTSSRLEMQQKKNPSRLKSNSYRLSNKDSSLMFGP